MLLEAVGITPEQTLLIRHQKVVSGRPTPYALWRDKLTLFEAFQATQNAKERKKFSRPYWASFVVTPDKCTLFVGIYVAKCIGTVADGTIDPLTGLQVGMHKPSQAVLEPYDQYDCRLDDRLSAYRGRLSIDWGEAHRSWVQVAGNQDKPIIELLRKLADNEFPGFSRFICRLSEIASLPQHWVTALASVKGIYLLTCPNTREQYVGLAGGQDGFMGRWLEYAMSNHGGNVGLKSRDPSDYQVSILEVCGSQTSMDDMLKLEALWKQKLQSREMGLNRN